MRYFISDLWYYVWPYLCVLLAVAALFCGGPAVLWLISQLLF